jgi:hypothetical protein
VIRAAAAALAVMAIGPAASADEPRPDEASGVVTPRAERDPAIRAVLAVPRAIVGFLLEVPVRLAAEIDDYLEAQGPNSSGRGAGSGLRAAVMSRWETELGVTAGGLIGQRFGPALGADIGVALFGRNGQTASVELHLGRHTGLELRPRIHLLAGRDRDRIFHGVSDAPCADGGVVAPADCRGPLATYDERLIAASAAIDGRLGPLRLTPSFQLARVETDDGGDRPASERYDTAALAGYGQTDTAVVVGLAATFDNRSTRYWWLPEAAPSSGTRARARIAAVRGELESMSYTATTIDVDVEHLVDLFRGNRVLSARLRGAALVDDPAGVPFWRLPSLGGAGALRALPAGDLRDRITAHGLQENHRPARQRAVGGEPGHLGAAVGATRQLPGLHRPRLARGPRPPRRARRRVPPHRDRSALAVVGRFAWSEHSLDAVTE